IILNPDALDDGIPVPTAVHGDDNPVTWPGDENPMTWAYHLEDVPPEIVAQDAATDVLAPWKSATVPDAAILGIVPGQIASEAASVTVPVFIGVGERDVVPNPWLEPFAYRSCTDITMFVCPGMAHM